MGRNNTFALRDEELLLPAFFPHTTVIEASSAPDDDESSVYDDEETIAAATAENDETDSSGDDSPVGDEAKRKRIDQTAKAALLLSKKKPPSRRNTSAQKQKSTSVGKRRVGSATTARNSGRSITRLVDAARIASTTAKPTNDKDDTTTPNASLRRAMIDSTVEEMMTKTTPSMGVLGEAIQNAAPRVAPRPKPGTVLVKSKRTLSSYANSSDKSVIDVRVATSRDDLDIANLRLSVFSDFTPQTRKLFCDRSCHLLATRRQRGAMCLVAVEPKRSMLMSPSGSIERDPVVGTAEISFHEFSDTRLGRARQADKILYVTEVAVSDKYRRKGIAKLMMTAIDKIASIRKIETIYLHVDVDNKAALRLYEKSGFKKLPSNNAVFHEFTRKLNLHDGATKGRCHFLMYKDFKEPTWLEDIHQEVPSEQTQRGNLGIEVLQ